jgi:hypothetical protein
MSSNTEMQTGMIEMVKMKCLEAFDRLNNGRNLSEREAEYSCKTKIDLSIKSMHDIKVNVELKISWTNPKDYPQYASLTIEANDILFMENEDIESYILFSRHLKIDCTIPPIDNIANFLQESADILNHLVFDKAMGTFTIPSEKSKSMLSFCEAFGITNPAIKSHLDTCCVCYEKTSTKTSCEHILCIPCWSSIKRTESEDSDYETKKCPICRQELFI